MATYVNDLRLTELATGEGSGTWGTTTNTNLELIGEALGYGTQDCFATDADATTTVADGATDPARAMYFKVTSSATLTATRTLTIAPNTMTRVMLIENATTGSQSIAISQGSGGNVTIANGAVKMVYLDGAGAGAAVVDALADLELGTITVANLTATTADINGGTIDGATIGGASAGAGTFTNLTASGTVSFSGATVSDGGTVTTVNIDGGSIDGTIIGAASTAAGSFTTLQADTSLNVDGTVTVDGLTSSQAAEIFSNAFSGGETPALRLSNTSEGVGTTATLEFIAGSSDTSANTRKAVIENISTTASGSSLHFYTTDDGTNLRKRMLMQNNGDISFYEDTGTTAQLVWDASADALTFGDNVKATFGAGSDLQIYHDGTYNFINAASGQFIFMQADELRLRSSTSETYFAATLNGATTLYHDASAKLSTTATGIDVTGIITADGLTVDPVSTPVITMKDATGTKGYIIRSSVTSSTDFGLRFRDIANKELMQIAQNGDISFYEDTGTTPKFFWDASAEALGVGTSSPSFALQVETSANSNAGAFVRNNNTGASASGNIAAATGVGSINLRAHSAAHSVWPNTSMLFSDSGFTGGLTVIQAGANPISMWTNSSERMRIDSSGNVGIGTTNPAADLHVSNAAGSVLRIDTQGGTNADSVLNFRENGVDRASLYWDGADNDLYLETTAGDIALMPSGNVGIGTTSPSQPLHVYHATTDTVANFESGDASVAVNFTASDNSMQISTSSTDGIIKNDGAGNFRLFNNGSERMRIDSSGNLLVGKTATNYNNDGFQAFAGGFLHATGTQAVANSGTVATLNRKSTDGSIVDFRKDGTLIGDIGNNSNDLAINSQGGLLKFYLAGSRNYTFDTVRIYPETDNARDLGLSSNRFKDLYLSGGVYLGGTGAANLLDDYEEGTWTPTVEGSTTAGSATYSFQAANYTKVGNLVMAAGRVSFSGHTGTGSVQIHGLPFTSTGTGLVEPPCVIFSNNITLTADHTLVASVRRSDTYFEALEAPVGGGALGGVTMDAAGSFYFTVIYQAS